MFRCSNWNLVLTLTDIFKTVRGPNGRFWRVMWVSEVLRRRARIGLQLSRFCFCFFSIFHFEASGMLIGYYLLVVHRSSQCRYGRKKLFVSLVPSFLSWTTTKRQKPCFLQRTIPTSQEGQSGESGCTRQSLPRQPTSSASPFLCWISHF